MSEEVKIKISQPMFQDGELERFDSNIHSIVEEYSKMMVKEKDQILTQRIIMKQEQEIEILNKQIKEYQKALDETVSEKIDLYSIINKIREYVYKPIDKEWNDILCIIEDGLKGSDKE